MVNKSQHIITITVLICFLFYTCGNVILFNYRLDNINAINNVKNEGTEKAHILTKLVIPLKEIRWKHEFEFYWNGFMYDIAEKEIINDTLYCLAYQDIEETALKKELAEHFETNKSQKNNPKVEILKFPDFIKSSNKLLIHPEENILAHQYYFIQTGRIFCSLLFIPPDIC